MLKPHRNAAALAFDLDAAKTMAGPQATCIANLSVFTAGHTETQAGQRISLAMEKLQDRFDCILLYGPQRMPILAGKTAARFHALIFVKPLKNTDSIRLSAGAGNFVSTTVLSIPASS